MYNVSNASVPSVRCLRSVLSQQVAKVASRRLRSRQVSRRLWHCGHRLWRFACKEPVAAAAHSGCLINKYRPHITQSGSANRSRRPRFVRDLCYFVFELKNQWNSISGVIGVNSVASALRMRTPPSFQFDGQPPMMWPKNTSFTSCKPLARATDES